MRDHPMPAAIAAAVEAGTAWAVWNDMSRIWITYPRIEPAQTLQEMRDARKEAADG